MNQCLGYHANHIGQTATSKGFSSFYSPQFQQKIIKIKPGEIYCSDRKELIATGLGSCICVCAWDPYKGIGGINHFLLPNQDHRHHWNRSEAESNESRYGQHAMELLINGLIQLGADKYNLHFKLFGGASMFQQNECVGERNIEFMRHFVKQEKLVIDNHDLGGNCARKVIFEPTTGKAWLKRITMNVKAAEQEKEYHHLLAKELEKQVQQSNVELF
ncbi:chemotaxis protein CheD [Vibrio sp.]|nr:chemotaxis protein CheD [Vibrio sp.]